MNGTPEADKIKKFLIEEMGVKKIRFPKTSSIGIKPVSLEGTERLVRQAIKLAILKKHSSTIKTGSPISWVKKPRIILANLKVIFFINKIT